MDDLDWWVLGDALGSLFEFCRRWRTVILTLLVVGVILAGFWYYDHQQKDTCQAKGGVRIDTTDHGPICMKGTVIK